MPSQRGIRAGKAYVELYADDNRLARGLKSAQKRLRNFGRAVRALGLQMMGAAGVMAAPFAYGVKAAGDAMETLNKFEQVFGTQAKAAGEFADALARSVGRSRYEIRDSLSSLQAFFVGLGFGGEEARKMSQEVEKLTLDFASLYNIQDPEALEKFQSGLAGMSRPLRQYGINLLDSAVQAEALAMGLGKGRGELTEQEKVLARLSIIMKSMTEQGAVGDAIRTAGSFQNRMKALRAQIRDTAVEIGSALLPVVTPLVGKAVEVVKVMGQWIKEHKAAVVMVAKLVALLGAAGAALVVLGVSMGIFSTVLGGLSSIVAVVAGVFGTLVSVIGALLSPIGLVIGAVGVLSAYLVKATGAGGKALSWLAGRFESLKEDALAAFGGIKDALAAGDIGLAAKILWLTLKMEWEKGVKPLKLAWHNFVFGFRAAFEIATHAIEQAWLKLTYALQRGWTRFSSWWKATQTKLSGWFAKRMLEVQGLFDETLDVQYAKRAVEESTRADLARIDRESDARLRSLTDEQHVAERLAREDHDRRLAQISDEHDARIAATEDALGKAKQEWKDAIDQASQARVEAEAEAAAPEGPGEPGSIRSLLDRLGRVGSAVSRAGSVAGTFSSVALGGLGMGNAMDRTARASEETAKNTRRLLDEAKAGGLTFA